MNNAKIWSFRALALLLSLGVSLGLAEVLLGITNTWVGRHSDTMFEIIQHDPELGWRMVPNQEFLVDLVDVEDIPVTSNSQGFWDDEFPSAAASRNCRIALLGDSFTWGFGVHREQRFDHHLKQAAANWRTLNFGMPGYGPDQSLLTWRLLAADYEPDVVVFVLYQNDYGDAVSQIRNGRAKPYFELRSEGLALRNTPVDNQTFWDHGMLSRIAPPYQRFYPGSIQKRSRLMHWLSKKSDLARLAYTFYRIQGRRSAGSRNSPGTLKKYDLEDLSQIQRLEVDLMSALLRQFRQEVESSGARMMVVLAGDAVPQFGFQHSQMSRDGIVHLDLTTPTLEARFGLAGDEIYFTFNKHWTPEAHRLVGLTLARKIQEQNWCP